MQKYDFKTKQYVAYEVPDSWHCPLIIGRSAAELEQIINCAECGKHIVAGDGYTSKAIHNDIGFGYAVCPLCHDKERAKELKAHE